MKKRLIAFSMNHHFFDDLKPVFEKKKEGKIAITACLFSTAYNRNKSFFQVSKLMSWGKKLESILHNFNHDLSISGNKYFGNKTKLTKIWTEIVDGELEIWTTLESSDPEFIARKDEITAPSIEIMVDPVDIIINENGEYYIDFDFVGVAWLLGIPAGSGNTRISEIREFSTDLSSEIDFKKQNNAQNMNEEHIHSLLEEQNKTLTENFSVQIEGLKKEFAETIGQSQREEETVHNWKDCDGNEYRMTSVEIYKSITELLSKNKEIDEKSSLGIAMKAKGYSIVKEPTEIEEAEKKFGKAEEMITKMRSFRSEEGQENHNGSANAPADTKDFKSQLNEQIKQNLQNINI